MDSVEKHITSIEDVTVIISVLFIKSGYLVTDQNSVIHVFITSEDVFIFTQSCSELNPIWNRNVCLCSLEVCVCVSACVRECVRAWVRACVCVQGLTFKSQNHLPIRTQEDMLVSWRFWALVRKCNLTIYMQNCHVQLKLEVYIHLTQIHLNSVFHKYWYLILVKMPCLGK
jgi:hypothetical protein